MPHLKCVSCRTRSYTPGGAADQIEDLCPGCGSAFEPVSDLSELVGFRAITARDGPQRGLVERLGGLLDRRAREQAARDMPWADDGAIAEAGALPRPGTPC